jgi:tripartite-type tricarboxylate transporter receptor subunit TctC
MREISKTALTVGGLLVLFLFAAGNPYLALAKDEGYPVKPVNFIIPYSPGGATDITSRVLVEVAKKYLGQSIVPINKGGAGGSIGTMAVISAEPDGYTIGAAVPSSAFAVPFQEGAPFKDLSGLVFIMNYGDYVYPILVRADSNWKTWKELIEWARKNPGDANVGLTASKKQSAPGLVFRQIEQKEKVKFTYIPFKGNADVTSALLGGHITVFGASTDASTVSLLQANRIRVLMYMSKYKLPGFENVSTTTELYGIDLPSLLGVWGPRGLSEYVVSKLRNAFGKAVEHPDFIKVMKQMYMPIVYMDSDEMKRFAENTFQRTKVVLRTLEAEEGVEDRK